MVLSAIATAFHTDIVSEHEPQYWGFESQEEWDQAMDNFNRESEDQYYAELLKFLAGDPCDIRPGTLGMTWAEIAEQLLSQASELATPAYKTTLMEEIHRVYDRDHAVRLTGNDSDNRVLNQLHDIAVLNKAFGVGVRVNSGR